MHYNYYKLYEDEKCWMCKKQVQIVYNMREVSKRRRRLCDGCHRKAMTEQPKKLPQLTGLTKEQLQELMNVLNAI